MKMNMTTPTVSQEALDAAAEEQIVPISKEGLKRIRRVAKIDAQMKVLEAEREDIKASLKAEMEEKSAKVLAYRNVPTCALTPTTKTTTNTKGLFRDFPQLEPDYVTRTPSSRFDFKTVTV